MHHIVVTGGPKGVAYRHIKFQLIMLYEHGHFIWESHWDCHLPVSQSTRLPCKLWSRRKLLLKNSLNAYDTETGCRISMMTPWRCDMLMLSTLYFKMLSVGLYVTTILRFLTLTLQASVRTRCILSMSSILCNDNH